jgi:flagellar biosynthesis protein FlhF
MKIKRYFAPDIRAALKQVREAQGPDAVILSNREVDGGVEIVAAVDYDALLNDLGVNGANASAKPVRPKTPAKAFEETEEDADAVPASSPLNELQGEIRTLRGMLEGQLAELASSEAERRYPKRALLTRRLRELGLSAALVDRIAAKVNEHKDFDSLWREALAVLAHQLAVTNDDIVSQGGVVALIGPTGVGKTTTVAKLAARFILRHGARSVAILTTDDRRIGAYEQIKIYGRILDAPTRLVRDLDSLRAALTELRHARLILIDTAGMSPRDMDLSEQFRLLANSREIHNYLVLSANTQLSALEETVRAFAPAHPKGVIVTKIDEATSLGGALSVACLHGLSIAYVSDGQRVPEDLRPARSPALVSRAVALQRQTEQRLASIPGAPRRAASHGI